MPGRITSSAFIGRTDELQNLLAAFEATRTAPAVVLLGGEAGVGKTRLVNEFSGRIPEARALVGACLELGQAVMPLAPPTEAPTPALIPPVPPTLAPTPALTPPVPPTDTPTPTPIPPAAFAGTAIKTKSHHTPMF